jgi:uncharacterized repeat protein (TIGR01451 family)
LNNGQIIDQLNPYECYVGWTIYNSAGIHNHVYTFFSGATQINPTSWQNYCGIRIVVNITANGAQSPAIMPGSSWHASFKTVYTAGAFWTTINNCVTSTPAQGWTWDNSACAQTIISDLPKADPTITCTVTPPSTVSGWTITYTCSYHNNGPDTATWVVVTFPFPNGFTPSTGSVPYSSTWVVIPVWVQPIGVTWTFTITWVVVGASWTILVTTWVITWQTIDTNLNNNHSPVQIIITDVPTNDLSITKTINKTWFKAGETVTYQIVARNNGAYTDTWVRITDTWPNELTFVSSNPNYSSVAWNTYTWSWITLAPWASTSITLTWTVKSWTIVWSNFVNIAVVSWTLPDPIPNNTWSVTGTVTQNVADPTITCTVSAASVVTNTTISYTCSYHNNWPDTATWVVVTFPFPNGFTPSTGSVPYSSTWVVIPVW